MLSGFVTAVLLIITPIIVSVGIARMMWKISKREYVEQRLARHAATIKDSKHLMRRFLGYDIGAVNRHWDAFDECAYRRERRFLQLDLFFPPLYGGAIAGSLLISWTVVDKPFSATYLFAPVVICMLADWVENYFLLGQLARASGDPPKNIQAGRVRIASAATITKNIFLGISFCLLVALAGYPIVLATT